MFGIRCIIEVAFCIMPKYGLQLLVHSYLGRTIARAQLQLLVQATVARVQNLLCVDAVL